MTRSDGRKADELRPVKITPGFLAHPVSSVLMEMGGTKVICAVCMENKVPGWMKTQKVAGGWLTCEYGLMPSATHERCRREASAGKQGGRTMEIQRLIGRSLRGVVDLESLGENTFYMDCDVFDADGGTRCCSITGASVALEIALRKNPLFKAAFREPVAAVSVGIVNGELLLDLNYAEDSNAEVDMNVVMTASGKLIEVQGTAEGAPFSRKQLNELIDLAEHGLKQIFVRQKEIVESVFASEPKKSVRKELGNLGDAFDKINL
ncbi:MAG: ribonuclease PH [Lentisphaeria bacterium]|nr:ribonuclease PH [Lentisphaeria bacterium]